MGQKIKDKIEGTAKAINEEKEKANKRSIYLYGTTGVGKTTILKCFWDNIKLGGYKTKSFIILSDFFDKLLKLQAEKGTYLYDLDETKKKDILFIDDLGVEKYSEFREEIIYKIINYRYENNLPTIISSNLSIKELEAKYSDRISSRISGMCLVKRLVGEDKRQ